MVPKNVLKHIQENNDRAVAQLTELLRIPSISNYSASANDVRRAAGWLLDHLGGLGFTAELHETAGHPVVYAELCPYPDRPTLLIYGHYDVQPPEPLEEWKTRPFEPAVEGGYIYGRGATDDKGQLFTYLRAIAAILEAEGRLPLNVKFVVEGEEELGSPNFEAYVQARRDQLRADIVALSDGEKLARDLPAICYGIRGLVYMQLDIEGPRFDVHSGLYGGAVPNPAQALIGILGRLKDGDGRVLIPGFYDRARDIAPWERKEMAALPLDDAELMKYLGVDALAPEKGYTAQECMRARPTLDINGLWGGFQGEGSKTIIPGSVGVKVSMRLVPDQDPLAIMDEFERYVRALLPPGYGMKITRHAQAEPLVVARESPAMAVAEQAVAYGFGRRPALIREGGSVGAVMSLHRQLGIDDILMLGWGDPDDGLHSPNERFSLENFYRGTLAVAKLLYGLADLKKPARATALSQTSPEKAH